MRFGEVAKGRYITQRQYAKAAGITPHELSQINQDHLLPTRDKLRRLCEAAGCMPTDVYTPEELDLVGCMGGPQDAPGEPKDKRDALYKRLSFRVPRSIATTIPDDLWPVPGAHPGGLRHPH